jgi:hypothetical protein
MIGAYETNLGKKVLEKVYYSYILFETCNRIIKKKKEYKDKIRKQFKAKVL